MNCPESGQAKRHLRKPGSASQHVRHRRTRSHRNCVSTVAQRFNDSIGLALEAARLVVAYGGNKRSLHRSACVPHASTNTLPAFTWKRPQNKPPISVCRHAEYVQVSAKAEYCVRTSVYRRKFHQPKSRRWNLPRVQVRNLGTDCLVTHKRRTKHSETNWKAAQHRSQTKKVSGSQPVTPHIELGIRVIWQMTSRFDPFSKTKSLNSELSFTELHYSVIILTKQQFFRRLQCRAPTCEI